MRRILAAALPLCLIALFLVPAEARPRAVQIAGQMVCDSDARCRESGSIAAPALRQGIPVRVAGGRPAGCPHAWCGCWLGLKTGLTDRSLWLARNWARVGSPASGPAPGVIAVWRHHVGQVTGVPGPGLIVLLSGNDGRAVRERERSSAGVIAWRRV
jgi:hypothetical protein